MTLDIYIGDTTTKVRDCALANNPAAYLLSKKNYKDFLKSAPKDTTVYTSLGDLPADIKIINQLLDLADHIFYIPESVWSDKKKLDAFDVANSMQGHTESILSTFHFIKKNVHNLDLSKYKSQAVLSDTRKTDKSQLWIAGCSISHGVGVDGNQRYGQLLADQLAMHVSFLTQPGSCIGWAADQILRSDIQSNDIVVWGLTSINRLLLYESHNNLWHLTVNWQQRHKNLNTDLSDKMIDQLLLDPTRFYQAVIHVEQVINFCRKIKAKLIVVNILSNDQLSMHLSQFPEFVYYSRSNCLSNRDFIDVGSDGQHPGIEQHKIYTNHCVNSLNSLNYI